MANPIDNLTPWKKGQSGNPGGRPKGKLNLNAMLEKFMENEIDTPKGKKQAAELFIEGLFKNALKGNSTAINQIIDRLAGKVKDQIKQDIKMDGVIFSDAEKTDTDNAPS